MNNFKISSHNIFEFNDVGVVFSSYFDNGNLNKVEKINSNENNMLEFKIWTANDNFDTQYQSKTNNGWFHFNVTGLKQCQTIRIYVMTSGQSALYRHDMVSYRVSLFLILKSICLLFYRDPS